jgi:LruC domain-containing protein
MKNIVFVLIALISFSGCSKIDLYKETPRENASLFNGHSIISEAFNWSSTKTIDVRIPVEDKYDAKYFYKVELFENDPVFGTNANLLAAGLAKGTQDYTGQISIPTALDYIYLKETSPVGVTSVSMLPVKNINTLTVSKTASVAGVSKRASGSQFSTGVVFRSSSPQATTTGSMSEIPTVTVPANAVPLVGNTDYGWNDVNTNKAFVVKAGTTFTGSVALNNGVGNIKVFVEGTWDASSKWALDVNNNNGIIVMNGGTLKMANFQQGNQGFLQNFGTTTVTNNLGMSNGSGVTYLNAGTLNVTNDFLMSSGGTFINYSTGKLNVKKFNASSENTKIENEGTLTVSDEFAIPSTGHFINKGTATVAKMKANSTGLIRNLGTLNVKTGEITNATVEAVCHTIFETLNTNGGKYFIFEGSMLKIGTLIASGSEFNLPASSILDVTDLAQFTSSENKIIGTGASKALARLKKVQSAQSTNGGISYSGNLEVACSDHTANGQWNRYYTITSPAVFVPYDQSTVVIASTDCNGGGNNNPTPGTPGDQVVPEVVLGTYSYAFEDNWPSFGDYDMNDFVVDVKITKYQNEANKVTKVKLENKIRSVGANKRLAAAIQLDKIPVANVKSVVYSKSSLVGVNVPLTEKGVEAGQTYAVVSICDDAHKAFGISNTSFISTQGGEHSPVDAVITIEFNTPLDNFTYSMLNTFIITNGYQTNNRSEVHLAGYDATDKINRPLVLYQTDNVMQLSKSNPFRSHDGYPWAICVPVSFVYPAEWKSITGVYSKFENWAKSAGTTDQDWYTSTD